VNFDGITGRGLPLSGASATLLPFLAESHWYDKKVKHFSHPGKDAPFFGGYGLIKGASRHQEIGGHCGGIDEASNHIGPLFPASLDVLFLGGDSKDISKVFDSKG
jgi:hypothetical protein